MASDGNGSITDVPGILVGHSTEDTLGTGCTVVLCEQPHTVAVDITGGGPSTRDTALCSPFCYVKAADAILLAGGSAFGLASVDGVMRFLAERGRGFTTANRPIPIVPGAVIYDLNVGDPLSAPTDNNGYAAAACADNSKVTEGRIGAGTGALVGKVRGPQHAMFGGVGSSSVRIGNELIVGALAVANSFGDIRSPKTGEIVAGAKNNEGTFLDTERFLLEGNDFYCGYSQNTTLAVIATNAQLSKTEVTQLARIAQNGLTRTVVPCGTQFDGDTVFALATGAITADITTLGVAAAYALSEAIFRAVTTANSTLQL